MQPFLEKAKIDHELKLLCTRAKNRVENYMRKRPVGEKISTVRTVNGYFLIFFVRNQTEIVVLPNGANGMRNSKRSRSELGGVSRTESYVIAQCSDQGKQLSLNSGF